MTYFTINDLEAFSGIRKHTIRIWEQRYAFLQPKRNLTLRRVYTPEELNILLNVARLNQGGLRVSRIAKMVEEKKQSELSGVAAQKIKAIHDLIIAMAEMDTDQFNSVLVNSMDVWGIEETIEEVILPFCERVGLLHKLDTKNYLENALMVIEIIKQKFYAAIEKIQPYQLSHKTALLFLMKGEQQELKILYVHYLLRKQGYQVVSLGSNASMESITTIVSYKKPDFIITSQLEKREYMEWVELIKQLPECAPDTKWISIGAALPKTTNLQHYKQVDTPAQLMTMLNNT